MPDGDDQKHTDETLLIVAMEATNVALWELVSLLAERCQTAGIDGIPFKEWVQAKARENTERVLLAMKNKNFAGRLSARMDEIRPPEENPLEG